jgi:hypothetical protein
VGVKVELGLGEAVDLLAEPAVKSVVIRPGDHVRIRMHQVASYGDHLSQ